MVVLEGVTLPRKDTWLVCKEGDCVVGLPRGKVGPNRLISGKVILTSGEEMRLV
jgi:hypothetical protein